MTEHGSDAGPGDAPELLPDVAANAVRARRPPRRGKPPNDRPKAPRASKAEIYERVSLIMRLIVEGVCRERSILHALATLHAGREIKWKVRAAGVRADKKDRHTISRRTVQLYIARALVELQSIADEPRAVAKSKARARYERALEGAAKAGAWDVVRRVTRDMVRLDGLEPGGRITVDGTVHNTHEGAVDIVHRPGGTIEERAAAVTDLLGRAVLRREQVARQSAAQANAHNN